MTSWRPWGGEPSIILGPKNGAVRVPATRGLVGHGHVLAVLAGGVDAGAAVDHLEVARLQGGQDGVVDQIGGVGRGRNVDVAAVRQVHAVGLQCLGHDARVGVRQAGKVVVAAQAQPRSVGQHVGAARRATQVRGRMHVHGPAQCDCCRS